MLQAPLERHALNPHMFKDRYKVAMLILSGSWCMALKKKSVFVTEKHSILGGKSEVLRTTQSGKIYQFRMWITGEKKYVRESLKTDILTAAVKAAENRTLSLLGSISVGKQVFGLTVQELVDNFMAWRQEDVVTGQITKDRWSAVRSQLKHFVVMVGGKTSVSNLNPDTCYGYANWRRVSQPNTTDKTILNEKSSINQLMDYAFRKGNANFSKFDFRKQNGKSQRDENRRGTFTLAQYDQLVKFMRSWASKKNCGDDIVLLRKRKLVQDCVLFSANTMMRPGEVRQLLWGDILGYESAALANGVQVQLVSITLRAATVKTRQTRTFTLRGGQYLRRIAARTANVKPSDFVFSGDAGDEKFDERVFNSMWAELMAGIKLDYKSLNITWYSLRHFGITQRLRAGNSIYDVSEVAGTSVAYIQKHYGHFDQEMSKRVALKEFALV